MRRVLSFLCVFSLACGSQSEPPPPTAAAPTQGPQAKGEVSPARRMVIRQASLQLRSEPRQLAERAGQIAAAAGGFVLNSEARSAGADVDKRNARDALR